MEEQFVILVQCMRPHILVIPYCDDFVCLAYLIFITDVGMRVRLSSDVLGFMFRLSFSFLSLAC